MSPRGLGLSLSVLLPLVFVMVSPLVQASTPVSGQMVLDVSTKTWEAAVVGRPSVIYDGSSFMMWYHGETVAGVDSIGLATSTDGISWSRYLGNPVLKPGSGWDANSVLEPWVIFQAGQYKMWYTGQTMSNGQVTAQAIGYASSSDGIHWTEYSGNPVLAAGPHGAWDDRGAWLPVVVPTGSSYVMYYRGITGDLGQTGMATSSDGVHWTKGSVISIPRGASGWDSYIQRVTSVTKVGGVYTMWYDGRKGSNAISEIGCANSTEGISWNVFPNNPVITRGSSGGWDSGGVWDAMPVSLGDKYYVYYSSFVGSSKLAIGLAILPMSQYPIPEFPLAITMAAAAVIMTGLALKRNKWQR